MKTVDADYISEMRKTIREATVCQINFIDLALSLEDDIVNVKMTRDNDILSLTAPVEEITFVCADRGQFEGIDWTNAKSGSQKIQVMWGFGAINGHPATYASADYYYLDDEPTVRDGLVAFSARTILCRGKNKTFRNFPCQYGYDITIEGGAEYSDMLSLAEHVCASIGDASPALDESLENLELKTACGPLTDLETMQMIAASGGYLLRTNNQHIELLKVVAFDGIYPQDVYPIDLVREEMFSDERTPAVTPQNVVLNYGTWHFPLNDESDIIDEENVTIPAGITTFDVLTEAMEFPETTLTVNSGDASILKKNYWRNRTQIRVSSLSGGNITLKTSAVPATPNYKQMTVAPVIPGAAVVAEFDNAFICDSDTAYARALELLLLQNCATHVIKFRGDPAIEPGDLVNFEYGGAILDGIVLSNVTNYDGTLSGELTLLEYTAQK